MRALWQRLTSTRAYTFVRHFVDEWQDDRCSGMAAEIAFFALLGLFPTLLVMAATFGWFEPIIGTDASDRAQEWMIERVEDVFGAESEVPAVIEDLFDGANTGAFTAGLLVAVYSASRGFAAVVRAIDVAYDHPDRRGWLGVRSVGLALALGTAVIGVLVVLILVIGPLFGSGRDIADSIGAGGAFATVWDWLRWPVALALLAAWAATLYHVAPNRHTPWRYDVPGALLATGLWVLATWGFTLYLRFASDGANAVFGLLGGAISLILWFYLLAMGLLAGAEVNGILADERDLGRARRSLTLRELADRARDLIDDEPDGADDDPDR